MSLTHFYSRLRKGFWLGACLWLASGTAQADSNLDQLLDRVGQRASSFLQQFSESKCTEKVLQEKFNKDGKMERNAEATYDYLVILSNSGGELSLNESRLVLREAKADKQKTSFLVSNGFATLFLVFHPYYTESFKFTALDDGAVNGHRMRKIGFRHIRGTRSPAALSLRGREYPLELSGTAWIDPDTGSVARLVATIGNSMENVGLKAMESQVDYAPIAFRNLLETYWFPLKATVEVETPGQHWRNTHNFSEYKLFSVNTEEKARSNK